MMYQNSSNEDKYKVISGKTLMSYSDIQGTGVSGVALYDTSDKDKVKVAYIAKTGTISSGDSLYGMVTGVQYKKNADGEVSASGARVSKATRAPRKLPLRPTSLPLTSRRVTSLRSPVPGPLLPRSRSWLTRRAPMARALFRVTARSRPTMSPPSVFPSRPLHPRLILSRALRSPATPLFCSLT